MEFYYYSHAFVLSYLVDKLVQGVPKPLLIGLNGGPGIFLNLNMVWF